VKALENFGIYIPEEDLMWEARKEIINTIKQEIEIFRMERLKDPDEKDIKRILSRDPISSFKDPFTRKPVDIDFVKEHLGINF